MYCWLRLTGTGKSTLVTFIINALGLNPNSDDVAYVAYTGKASLVLKQKGCSNAMTAHRLLYNTKQRRDGSFFHIPKYTLDQDYALIIVDEISMLPKEMWELLLTHQVHIIALGDPGQLPPVSGDGDNHVLDNPHIFLTEVMRQASESEIIRCSMDIRAHHPLRQQDGNEVKVIQKYQATAGMQNWADQIICAKNATRDAINATMRERKYNTKDRFPLEGEKVICLRNNWDVVNARGDCLINGMTGTIKNIKKVPIHVPRGYQGFGIIADFLPDFYTGDEAEDGLGNPWFIDVLMDYELFMTGKPTLDKTNFAKNAKFYKPNEFDFGYAITCWKSQGSEYDKVLLYEENFPWEEESHYQYLYTGATRAKNRLVIVMK